MTPKQKKFLERLKEEKPWFFQKMDIEIPTSTKESQINNQISDRVQQILLDIASQKPEPRKIFTEKSRYIDGNDNAWNRQYIPDVDAQGNPIAPF